MIGMRGSTKEGELLAAVMQYVHRCLHEGDLVGLRGMGFGPADLESVGTMNLGDVQRAGSLSAHCFKIRLDASLFRRVVKRMTEMREEETLQRALIRADAPSAMMHSLFGMVTREYTKLRQVLDVETGVGRPATLDDDMENRLWSLLKGRLRADRERPLEPHEFLALHDEHGVPLRALWTHACDWAERLEPKP